MSSVVGASFFGNESARWLWRRQLARLSFSLCLAIPAWGLQAVIFYNTEEPAHSTTEPTGALAGSGWQYQGQWRGFAGTPIAADLFITANHVGGSIGEVFAYRGANYPTIASFPDPESDLIVWQVCGAFPDFAPLYATNDETGKAAVVFGRGATRGSPVVVTNGTRSELKGWYWGAADGRLRWGQNIVAEAVDGGPFTGSLLKATFDAGAGPDEAGLAGGDSGGGMFIQSGTTWRLAGIALGVEGPFNTTNTGAGFNATLFDKGGLYEKSGETWSLVPNALRDLPAAFYATRISSRRTWIESLIAAQAGTAPVPVLQSAPTVTGPYTTQTGVVVRSANRTITVPLPNQNRFYRLDHCRSLRLTIVGVTGTEIVFGYE